MVSLFNYVKYIVYSVLQVWQPWKHTMFYNSEQLKLKKKKKKEQIVVSEVVFKYYCRGGFTVCAR